LIRTDFIARSMRRWKEEGRRRNRKTDRENHVKSLIFFILPPSLFPIPQVIWTTY
jgi:hypothetical protein